VPTARETPSKITKINFRVAHTTEFSISPIRIPEPRPQVLLKNRAGCLTAKIIIDIATISEKFTWNFDFETTATQNYGHPTLMVLNSKWSILGLFSIIA
jgi:hypothetical protein